MEIPKELVVEMYDSLENKTWNDLFDEASYRINRPEGVDDRNLYSVQDFAEKMDDEPFPVSADDLYQMLVDRLAE